MDVGTGILTNNRRLVTKNMWFNGTALSAQARRALENERVTVVAHESGYIHIMFTKATIDPLAYQRFSKKLEKFLCTPFTSEILGNFVRHDVNVQKCFQVRWDNFGVAKYISVEKLLAYEYASPFRFNDNTRERLMMEVAGEDFESRPLPDHIILNDVESLISENTYDLRSEEGFTRFLTDVNAACPNGQGAIEKLRHFICVDPQLPNASEKDFQSYEEPLGLNADMSREEIITRLEAIRADNELADLAFYAYRDLGRMEPTAFLKAALERCPVSIAANAQLDDEAIVAAVEGLMNASIYDEPRRLAQPDEVWNYRRGDGAEKAVLLANILRARHPDLSGQLIIEITPNTATLHFGNQEFCFPSNKELTAQTWDCRNNG